MNVFSVYVFFYCGSVSSIYMSIVVACFNMWFGGYVAYDRDFGLFEGLECTMYAILETFLITLIASFIEHVSDLY